MFSNLHAQICRSLKSIENCIFSSHNDGIIRMAKVSSEKIYMKRDRESADGQPAISPYNRAAMLVNDSVQWSLYS